MTNKLILAIRRRSRESWQREARLVLESARAWTQVNGEWAAGIAFLTGIAIVLEFRIFLYLLILAALAAFAVWWIALPERMMTTSARPDPSKPTESH